MGIFGLIGFIAICFLAAKHIEGPDDGEYDEDYQCVEHLYKNYQDYLRRK